MLWKKTAPCLVWFAVLSLDWISCSWRWGSDCRSPGDGFALCRSIYWAAAGVYWCFPQFFLYAYSKQVVFLLKNFDDCKRKKLDILAVLVRANLKGSPGHCSISVSWQMVSIRCWKAAVCSGVQGIASLTSAWETFPSAPKSPGRCGFSAITLQHCSGLDVLTELPLLPSPRCRVSPPGSSPGSFVPGRVCKFGL